MCVYRSHSKSDYEIFSPLFFPIAILQRQKANVESALKIDKNTTEICEGEMRGGCGK